MAPTQGVAFTPAAFCVLIGKGSTLAWCGKLGGCEQFKQFKQWRDGTLAAPAQPYDDPPSAPNLADGGPHTGGVQ